MDSIFPFGLTAPTAFYLVLYVTTFAVHQAAVHYVVAGSLYVTWAVLISARAKIPGASQPLPAVLRDWMPFALSAAITAGVAPLLFVQILYARQFYTANLLLEWRWMIVIPVLITAFYLLYLLKSVSFATRPYPARSAIALTVSALFLFTGFCWVANHLIGNEEANWPQAYASGRVLISPPDVLLRMLIWVGGAFASMATIAGWQLAIPQRPENNEQIAEAARRLAMCALGGLAVAVAAATAYFTQLNAECRALVLGAFASPYLVLAVIGVFVQVGAWIGQRKEGVNQWLLAVSSGGLVLTLLASSVLRETIRLSAMELAELSPRHAQASEIGGLAVFLAFLVLNTVLIAGCIRLIRRRLSATPSD